MKIHPVKKTDITFMAELHRIHRDRVRRAKAALGTATRLKKASGAMFRDCPENVEVHRAQGELARRLRECEAVYKAMAALVRQAADEGLVALPEQEAQRRHDEAMRVHHEVVGIAERAPDAELVAAIAVEMGKPITERRAKAWAAKLAHLADWHEALEKLLAGLR